MIALMPQFQTDLFQPMEPPCGTLPTTLQPQTVFLLSELLLKNGACRQMGDPIAHIGSLRILDKGYGLGRIDAAKRAPPVTSL